MYAGVDIEFDVSKHLPTYFLERIEMILFVM